ncbi:MAG: molybdopterin oxidoreductase family protein [Pseudomonadota bacterium]
MTGPAKPINLSPPPGDAVKTTTCYMCACRCGIRVHLKDGAVRYIEGNREHPVNKGVLCAKGAAGIMQHYSPARLSTPLKRTGERGSGEFEPISWEEALTTAAQWLGDIRATDPRRLAFFTGRDQSQALTGWWAKQFGTPNFAAHGGFCSVNMAAAGMYTIGSAFWEFSEPDWERTRFFMLFGVAEDHASNPIKIGLSRLKERGAKFVSVNPVQTGYSGVANEWVGITPGTDGLFVLALVHELLRAGKVDVDYLSRYANAGWLVIQHEGSADHGLFARDADGTVLCWDRMREALAPVSDRSAQPALKGEFRLADGRRAIPVFQLLAERYLDKRYSPDAVAERTGVAAATIRRLAAEISDAAFNHEVVLDQPWTDAWGVTHETTRGRPVSMHAMRGISAHSNGFHTCRAIHLLQMLLGSVDTPGGLRYKPPYPKSIEALPTPTGRAEQVAPDTPLPGGHLGYPSGPDDLLVNDDGTAARIDKAFSWEAPLAAHGMMHAVIHNAWAGDPYPIDTLFMYMANMAWNSSMNTEQTIAKLTDRNPETGEYRIPHIIYSDAYASETVAYADLVLPDTTYLERWDAISLLDRPISEPDAVADAIRQPVLEPDRDVRPFQDVLLDLGARLGLEGMVTDDGEPAFPGGYADYIVNRECAPGIGTLGGWRGVDGEANGRGDVNPEQLDRYIENGCFWQHELADDARYFRFANRAWLGFAASMGFAPDEKPVPLNLYSEELQRFRLAAQGHGNRVPPQEHRERVAFAFDPLPTWYPPFADDSEADERFPLHAITQRPMAMYHSWGGQNAWLRQIHGDNRLYMARETATKLGIDDDDWVDVTSPHASIRVQVRLMDGVNPHTVWTWNAIGKRRGAWNLDRNASEATKGFLLNHLIDDLLPARDSGYRYSNSDPVTGQAAWYDLRVSVKRSEQQGVSPDLPPIKRVPGLEPAPTQSRFGTERVR